MIQRLRRTSGGKPSLVRFSWAERPIGTPLQARFCGRVQLVHESGASEHRRRVAIYCRVSTSDQDCDRKGWGLLEHDPLLERVRDGIAAAEARGRTFFGQEAGYGPSDRPTSEALRRAGRRDAVQRPQPDLELRGLRGPRHRSGRRARPRRPSASPRGPDEGEKAGRNIGRRRGSRRAGGRRWRASRECRRPRRR